MDDLNAARTEACARMTTKLNPDGMNGTRADAAEHAVSAFMGATSTDREDAIADLLTNLQHLCDREGIDFAAQLARANRNYTSETTIE